MKKLFDIMGHGILIEELDGLHYIMNYICYTTKITNKLRMILKTDEIFPDLTYLDKENETRV